MTTRPATLVRTAWAPCLWLAALLAGLIALGAPTAIGQVRVDITEGTVAPLPIAVTDFYGGTAANTEMGRQISEVVAADLARSGVFAPIAKGAFIQDASSLQVAPRFSDWRIINAQALVSGSVELQADGRWRAEYRLWDVAGETQMDGVQLWVEQDNWRGLAHRIADRIFEAVTGEPGYFSTRIVYVAESGPGTQRIKRLAIMDQDGENHRFLTDGGSLVLTPRFSPTAQEITYLAYYNNLPRVYLLNIDTGRQELLGNFPGMTFAPRFSPDGNRVVLSQAEAGNTDIYVMDLRTRNVRRLTSEPGIDTGASFAPEGDQIAFESDRGGTQQIYIMNGDGSGVRRLTFGEGRYGTPVWSPRGDYIAFTRQYQGRFSIGVIRPDGSGERTLIEGAGSQLIEGPTWAPNGRYLMYFSETPSSQGAQARLQAVDLTGRNSWVVPSPMNGSDPAWSPLIP